MVNGKYRINPSIMDSIVKSYDHKTIVPSLKGGKEQQELPKNHMALEMKSGDVDVDLIVGDYEGNGKTCDQNNDDDGHGGSIDGNQNGMGRCDDQESSYCGDDELKKPLKLLSPAHKNRSFVSSSSQMTQKRQQSFQTIPRRNSSINITPKEEQELELLRDTFSLLMIAKYPKRQLLFVWKYFCCGWMWNLIIVRCCCCCRCGWFRSPDRDTRESEEEEDDDDSPGDEEAQQKGREEGLEVEDSSNKTRRQRIRQGNIQRRRGRKVTKEQQHHQQRGGQTPPTLGSTINATTKPPPPPTISGFRQEETDYGYLPFWIAWGVFYIQMFIYFIVLADTVSNGEIPPNVDIWLRLAQIFAVLITIYTQADLIDGMYLLNEGYKTFVDITTHWKFRISVVLRIVSGIVGVTATFVLIIYSSEVVELLLNFSAMEFVSMLDDSCFRIASMGFLGSTLANKASIVTGYRYKPRHANDGIKSRFHCYLIAVVMVLAAFGLVWGLQVSRAIFADNEVYIQFDDTDTPELFGISGVYKGCTFGPVDGFGRIIYINVSQECPQLFGYPAQAFYYCKNIEGWVFARTADERVCWLGSYLLRSSKDKSESLKADAYDILSHADANWIYKRPTRTGGEIILDSDGMFVHTVRKYQNVFGQCSMMQLHSSEGNVDDDTANQEQQITADQSLNYSSLELDYFPSFDDEKYNVVFGLMYRPIFTRPVDGQDGKFHVLLYYGLRWLYLDLDPVAFSNFARNDEFYTYTTKTVDPALFCDDDDENVDPHCWKPFVKHFLSNDAWMFNKTVANVTAISDPMILLTGTDTGVPTSALGWYEVQKVETEYRYLQPSKQLPLPEGPGSSFTNFTTPSFADESHYFQCDLFEGTTCSEGGSLLFFDVTTDYFRDFNILAFLGQGVGDYDPDATNNFPITVKSNGKIVTLHDIIDNDILLNVTFADPQSRYKLSTCVSSSECVQVVFLWDFLSEPERYDIYYNYTLVDVHIANRFSDNECLLYQYGNNCDDLDGPTTCDSQSFYVA